MSIDIADNTVAEALQPGIDDRFTRSPVASDRWARAALRLVGPLALLGAWAVGSATGSLDPTLLPSPSVVGRTGWHLIASGQLGSNLEVSARRALVGLVVGVAAGVLLALVTGLSRVGESLLDTNLQMLRSMPILALLPLAIVWLGIGEEMKIALVALGVMFPIYLNTHAAIRGADVKNLDLAQTVGLSRLAMIRHVVLPGALPGFFTGLRFSVAIAWLVLVVAEQTNATSGIGFLMSQARSISRTDVIIVGLIVYALLGLVSDTLVRLAERRALRWRATR